MSNAPLWPRVPPRNSSANRGAGVAKENATPKTIGCAIYTRRSTEEGLQQEFNSPGARREATEAFISSQKREGCRIRKKIATWAAVNAPR
jgi:hypothetical protein